MLTEIKELQEKYRRLSKTAEYVAIGDVIADLYYLMRECRLKRIPKRDR